MVWVTVGRSGDELVGKVEASKRMHRRHLERVVQYKIREQARHTLSEHGLADAWRAMEEHVVSTCCGYFAGPLRLGLTDHIRQVKTTVRMAAASLTHDLDGVNQRYRDAAQKRDQLGDRGNTKDPNALNKFRLSGLAQWDDHSGEACLLSRQSGRQNAADGSEATIQPKLAQQYCSA
jgi:hypothetical protein